LGCSFRKNKAAPVAIAKVRLVLLPFNVPENNKELKWMAFAGPIMLAKTAELSKDIEIIPLWETMSAIRDTAGASRTFNEENAVTVATWVSAKWSVMGSISPKSKNGIATYVDFIPVKDNMVPFRYARTGRLDYLGIGFRSAYRQFLRYLTATPPKETRKQAPKMTSMRELAEALDREYGWFTEAQPGKAQESVSELMATDPQLARLLFSPTLYPIINQNK